uniref:OB domain-containing protein n=1 Tax=Thermofilum pendens TaxID=2269 RepID=A0A7C4FF48_THEPE
MEVVLDAYLKVKVSEITPENIVSEGPNYYLVVSWRELRLKTRKVCTAGIVESISSGSRFADVVLGYEGASVLVRVWSDRSVYENIAEISTGDAVKVLGTLRVFREQVYISPFALRRVKPEYLPEFMKRVERDREIIFASLAERLPAREARESGESI